MHNIVCTKKLACLAAYYIKGDFMLKIVLHCSNKEYKEIEPVLSEYLTNKNIAFEIYHVGSATKFLSDYLYQKDFQLLLVCKNSSLSYMLKTYYNFDKSYMHMVSGILELPLNFDSIDKELFNNIESTYCCPYGIYNVSNRKVFRKILHEDIEYIQRLNDKSVIFLRDGETEEINKSINKIKTELNEKYFIKCCKGYIVNIFNIEKVNKDTHTIELKSGIKIPLTRKNFQEFLKSYIFSVEGFRIWDY